MVWIIKAKLFNSDDQTKEHQTNIEYQHIEYSNLSQQQFCMNLWNKAYNNLNRS